MTNKKFTHVGTCTNPVGKTKLHFTNNPVVQTKKMNALGYDRVDFFELPFPMQKPEAAQYLLKSFDFKEPIVKACEHVIARFPITITAEQQSPVVNKVPANSTANLLG